MSLNFNIFAGVQSWLSSTLTFYATFTTCKKKVSIEWIIKRRCYIWIVSKIVLICEIAIEIIYDFQEKKSISYISELFYLYRVFVWLYRSYLPIMKALFSVHSSFLKYVLVSFGQQWDLWEEFIYLSKHVRR